MASPGKKPFLLRIDPNLWSDIERLAAAELRSVNAQVEYLLRDALRRRNPGDARRVARAMRWPRHRIRPDASAGQFGPGLRAR